MGTVLVSLDKVHEELLRKLAHEQGAKKGAISQVVMRALDKLKEDAEIANAKEQLKKTWDKGFKFKYTMYKNRSEIYD